MKANVHTEREKSQLPNFQSRKTKIYGRGFDKPKKQNLNGQWTKS